MEKVLVLDFGGQYNQLIARRVRENNVYCEVHGYNKFDLEAIKQFEPRGIILTGGPQSVNSDDFNVDLKLFELNVPILGICFGAQLMAKILGGKVEPASTSEFGHTDLERIGGSFNRLDEPQRSDRRTSARICAHGIDRQLSDCGDGRRLSKTLRRAVSPRGCSHRRG